MSTMAIDNGFTESYMEDVKNRPRGNPKRRWLTFVTVSEAACEYPLLFVRLNFVVWLNKRNGIVDAFRAQWAEYPDVDTALAWLDLIQSVEQGRTEFRKIPKPILQASDEHRLQAFKIIARLGILSTMED